MGRKKNGKRVAGWLGLCLVTVALLAGFNIGRIVTFAMTPSVTFDAQSPPPAPDYASPGSWSALPASSTT